MWLWIILIVAVVAIGVTLVILFVPGASTSNAVLTRGRPEPYEPPPARTDTTPKPSADRTEVAPFRPDTDSEMNLYDQIAASLDGVDLSTENPEQRMSVKYVSPDATVLELGASIGRNTLVLSRLTGDSNRLVTLEPNQRSVKRLTERRDRFGMKFNIVNGALSDVPLYLKGYQAYTADDPRMPSDAEEIKTISWPELRSQYPDHKFDTLIADCEGCLFPALRDHPDMLDGINLVQVEHDWVYRDHYHWFRTLMANKGFESIDSQTLDRWKHPLFLEVFRRIA